jgi:hypothetical protein
MRASGFLAGLRARIISYTTTPYISGVITGLPLLPLIPCRRSASSGVLRGLALLARVGAKNRCTKRYQSAMTTILESLRTYYRAQAAHCAYPITKRAHDAVPVDWLRMRPSNTSFDSAILSSLDGQGSLESVCGAMTGIDETLIKQYANSS